MRRPHDALCRAHLIDGERDGRHNDDREPFPLICNHLRNEALAPARRQGDQGRVAVRRIQGTVDCQFLCGRFELREARDPADQRIGLQIRSARIPHAQLLLPAKDRLGKRSIDIGGELPHGKIAVCIRLAQNPVGIPLCDGECGQGNLHLHGQQIVAQCEHQIIVAAFVRAMKLIAAHKALCSAQQEVLVCICRGCVKERRPLSLPAQIRLKRRIHLPLFHRSSPSKQMPPPPT